MDETKLRTSSEIVQSAVQELDSLYSSAEGCGPALAANFYVLDQFNSEVVEEYINQWQRAEYVPSEVALEYGNEIAYLIKLLRSRDRLTEQESAVEELIQAVEGFQRTSGHISNNHTPGLRALVAAESESKWTRKAIDYFLENWDSQSQLHYIAIGLCALCEFDYYGYKEQIIEIAAYLDEHAEDAVDSDRYLFRCPQLLEALSKTPDYNADSTEELATAIERRLTSEIEEEEPHSKTLSNGLLGLIAIGQGPKTSQYQMEWQDELRSQQYQRSRPQFVSTLPTTELRTRRKEIYENAKSIVNSTENTLRISTLTIDMLHEDIINLVRESPDTTVKLLTRPEQIRGERKKMKQAVLTELVRKLEGNVRGNKLIHSRMVISDDREVLISSADLSRDQLYDEYNAGIYTQDSESIQEAIDYFEKAWESSDPIDITDV